MGSCNPPQSPQPHYKWRDPISGDEVATGDLAASRRWSHAAQATAPCGPGGRAPAGPGEPRWLGDTPFFPRWLQRRALRTASEKLRNRSSFSTNVVHAAPGTRVNRYIGRLLEARQTDLEMADLNFFTLKYKQAEREHKVGDRRGGAGGRAPCGPA